MRYAIAMRTTLSIDDDVLAFARAKAEQNRSSVGEVISSLARTAIAKESTQDHPAVWNGILQLPVRDKSAVVTMEIVNALRDDDGV